MKRNLLLTSLLVAGMPLASCTSEDNVFDNSENTVKEFVLSIYNFKEDAEDSSTRSSAFVPNTTIKVSRDLNSTGTGGTIEGGGGEIED